MTTTPTPATGPDIGRLGRDAYDTHVRPNLRPEDEFQFVAVDVDTGDHDIDPDDYTALTRLLGRRPGARAYLARVGRRPAYHIAPAAGRIA